MKQPNIKKLINNINPNDIAKLIKNVDEQDLKRLINYVNSEQLKKLANYLNNDDIKRLSKYIKDEDIEFLKNEIQNFNLEDLNKYGRKLNLDDVDALTNSIKNLDSDNVDKYKKYFKLLNSGDYNISELKKFASKLNRNDISYIKTEIQNIINGSNTRDILLYQNILNKLKPDFIDINKFNSIEVLALIGTVNRLINNGRLEIDIIDMVDIVNQNIPDLINEFDKNTQKQLSSLLTKLGTQGSLSPKDIKKIISQDLSDKDIKVLKKVLEKSIEKNPQLKQEYDKVSSFVNEKQMNKLKNISIENIKNNDNLKTILKDAVKKHPELKNNSKYIEVLKKLEDRDFQNVNDVNNEDFKLIKNLVNLENQNINQRDKDELLKNLDQIIAQNENASFSEEKTINEYKNAALKNSNKQWINNELKAQNEQIKKNEISFQNNRENALVDNLINDLSEENTLYENKKQAEQKQMERERKEKERQLEINKKEWSQAYKEYNIEKNETQKQQTTNINENIEKEINTASKKICVQILKNVNMLEEIIQESKKELNNLKQQQAICKYKMNELGCSNINELKKKQSNTRLLYENIKNDRLQSQQEFNRNNCQENERCYKTNTMSRDFGKLNDFRKYEKKYERCVDPYKNKCACILNDLKKSQVITQSDLNNITNYVHNKESFANMKKETPFHTKYTNTIYLVSGGILLTYLLFKLQ